LPGLIALLTTAKELREPVLVHVVTKKGYGYRFAEEDPAKFHGIGKFDPATGKKLAPKVKTFSDAFGETMQELAEKNEKVCAITAAMPGGTGLLKFQEQFPKRTFDVGIAEEHAVSMAGGLAKQGMIPVVALYSTFLQRGYDQILQDIALLQLHVVLAIDRAGLVGDDGPTHHGVFDVGFLRQVPGMKILTPVSLAEQQEMLRWAVEDYDGPVAIRYPRGGDRGYTDSAWNTEKSYTVHRTGNDVTILTYGVMLTNALQGAEILSGQGIEVSVVRLMDLTDLNLDTSVIGNRILVLEETASGAGIGEAMTAMLARKIPGCQVDLLDLGREFIPHGSVDTLYRHYGLDGQSVADYIQEVLGK
jgi:1-deoxy-D-xylulose-5-phosphate synthase